MLGYQLGMHNWRILREDERVELSHNITFDESLYPGISTFDPAGLLNPPLVELFDEQEPPTPETPPPAAESHQSTDDDNEFERNLCFEELPDNSKEPAQSTSSSIPPCPGYDMVLQPIHQKAPRDISSNIDESNILQSKRRAHLAIVGNDMDFHIQCFMAGVQFFDQTTDAPKTYAKAMKDPGAASWTEAIGAELSAMERLGVWEIVDIPAGFELLNTVWIFRKKFDQNGRLSKFKARLCAAGNFQVEGINYAETYAPTGRPTSLQALLSMGVVNGLDIHQMDVKNAFLNGKLDESIYLRAPAGLSVPKGKCLHLLKSIYGLKQAPRVWHHELSTFFSSISFSSSPADPCLFVLDNPDWQCWVHVYVDNMVIVSKDVNRFKRLINAKYLMEDVSLCDAKG
jgi:hypothetical protein